jgi:hypothetical protein
MSYTTLKIKTRADLDQCIRERRKDQRKRLNRIKKVCDAVDGFCDATCGCEGSYFDLGVCYRCGNRIVAQFDILKEDGV